MPRLSATLPHALPGNSRIRLLSSPPTALPLCLGVSPNNLTQSHKATKIGRSPSGPAPPSRPSWRLGANLTPSARSYSAKTDTDPLSYIRPPVRHSRHVPEPCLSAGARRAPAPLARSLRCLAWRGGSRRRRGAALLSQVDTTAPIRR